MKKNIVGIIFVLFAAFLFAVEFDSVLAATTDFVADNDITVSGVTFGDSTVNLLIMNGSKAASWIFNGGVFTVTDPDATANFKVGSADSSVKSVIAKDSNGTAVACQENLTPSSNYVNVPTTSGTYTLEPSTAIVCTSYCSTIAGAASYNSFPTCGAASCNAGYSLSGTGASGTCTLSGGGGPSGAVSAAVSSVGLPAASTATPSPSPTASATPTPSPSVSPAAAATGTKPDGALIKYANDSKVYVLEGGKKRWVKTADDFTKLGYKWSDIKTIAASETYTEGEAKTLTVAATGAKASGALIKYAGDPKVYVIENNQKRWVKTADDFTKLGYKWSDIKTVSASETYADGAAKTSADILSDKGPPVIISLTKTLKKGSTGAEVKTLQQKLKDAGYFPSDQDTTTYFGPITQKALKDYQKARSLSPTGILDAKTREALNK